MTKPIEFRAWDNFDDVDKFTMHYQDVVSLLSFLKVHEDAELMQFTGLLDRHGKKIFEADILAVDWGDGIVHARVYWADGGAMYGVEFKGNKDTDSLSEVNLISEVIGNIYEHSELLK